MSIPTQMSLVGFIASAPELHFTAAGKEHVRVRVGIEHWRKEADGSFTELDRTFHDMVAFESTARETYARCHSGDSFVASGHVHEYEVENQDRSVIKEEFVARKIGHSANRTSYVVERGRGHQVERPDRPRSAGSSRDWHPHPPTAPINSSRPCPSVIEA